MTKSDTKPGETVRGLARATFHKTVSDAEQARVELVRLAKQARKIDVEKAP